MAPQATVCRGDSPQRRQDRSTLGCETHQLDSQETA